MTSNFQITCQDFIDNTLFRIILVQGTILLVSNFAKHVQYHSYKNIFILSIMRNDFFALTLHPRSVSLVKNYSLH